jgi:hypothetical protein
MQLVQQPALGSCRNLDLRQRPVQRVLPGRLLLAFLDRQAAGRVALHRKQLGAPPQLLS